MDNFNINTLFSENKEYGDCAIEEDFVEHKTNPEGVLPSDSFDYKDYHMISFTRLCFK